MSKFNKVTKAFKKFLKESTRHECKSKQHNPNQIRLHKGSKFYNRSMKSWPEKNYMEIHSTCNEGKYLVSERFIRTLKNKIYKYMTSVSKMYILIH